MNKKKIIDEIYKMFVCNALENNGNINGLIDLIKFINKSINDSIVLLKDK